MRGLRRVGFAVAGLAAAAVAQAPTAQQAYDAGQAAFEKGDWANAAAQFRQALALSKGKGRSAAVIRARLASALFNEGQGDAAEREAREALAQFGALGVAKGEDLAETHLLLGNVHRMRQDAPAAVAEFERAVATPDGPRADVQVLQARMGIGFAAMTQDPALAARTIDAVLADPAAVAKLGKLDQANIYAGRARAELNRGDAKAAVPFIERALDLTGRTTVKVNIPIVRVRGDAALIYAKLGNQDKVRELLTYSGAGHLPDNGWLTRAEAPLPICGEDVRPDDVAVVEFAIDGDGRTAGATAVYASRPGPMGAAFARSVKTWRWPPAAVEKLNAFWRSSVRVELRCVMRPPGVQLVDSFRDATQDWLAAQGVQADLTDPALKPGGAATPAGRALDAMAALRQASSDKERDKAAAALRAAIDAANAPVEARAYVAATIAQDYGKELPAAIADIQARPGSGRAAAWLKTELALTQERDGDLQRAHETLEAVTATSPATLPADDPIRQIALLHLSLIDKRRGEHQAAEARLKAAGVTADQCSLLDVRPVAKNMQISSSAFPTEALRWGFEGNVREAFDIGADGGVTGVRTVIAYPPFVFGPGTERAVRNFRYLPPTLGDQALGCVGQTVNVRYQLPD